jgi:two-component system, cell cycle sensor histidine kinase and response regulator CckA
MTGITGEALADLIHQSHPDMPVLFMSGYTEDAFSKTRQLKESASFLPKPFSADDLLQAVSKSLRKRTGSLP